MTAFPYTALITLLVLIVLFGTGVNVGRARGKYGVKAPAVSGHEMFERAFRVQMNTLESMALMLPALWVCAAYRGDGFAASVGLAWLLGRVWYAVAYMRDPAKREGGFVVTVISFVTLLLAGLWGVIATLFAGVAS